MLGGLPPMPRNAALRIVQLEEEEYDGAMVPTPPYFEDKMVTSILENQTIMLKSSY